MQLFGLWFNHFIDDFAAEFLEMTPAYLCTNRMRAAPGVTNRMLLNARKPMSTLRFL